MKRVRTWTPEAKARLRYARQNAVYKPIKCKVCGQEFQPRSGNAKICEPCRYEYYRAARKRLKESYKKKA